MKKHKIDSEMSIFESMTEAPGMGPLMEAFKTMARQMNLIEDQPVMHWGIMIWGIGVMIFLLMLGVGLLSYWWTTNPKKVDKNNNKPGSKATNKKTQAVKVSDKMTRKSPRKSEPKKLKLDK